MSNINAPRGTKDILPKDIPVWESLEQKARTLLKRYGYREIRTPLYEETSLFKRSLGDASEVVDKQLLELATRSEADLALRPEGTAPIVCAYNEHGFISQLPVAKFFYISPMFRGERPQKGRLRQFHQIGAEAIGWFANDPLLDAEMIILAYNILKSFGLNNFTLKINSLGTVEDKANFAGWLREQLKDKIADLSEECQRQYAQNVFRLLDSKDEQCRKVVDALAIDGQHLSEAGRIYFDKVKKALDQAGVSYEVSAQLVRGLDYYTHTVFEFSCPDLGAQDAIGAGGRYNGLIEQLGGGDRRLKEGETGAIGFALGMERIILAMGAEEFDASESLDVFLVSDNIELDKAFEISHGLRQNGISTDMDYTRRKFKHQMANAEKCQARYAVVINKDDTLKIKDMATGDQEIVSQDELLNVLQKKLKG